MTKKIKIGIVGLNFGKSIAEQQIRTGPGSEYFELAAVCDTNEELCQKVAEANGAKPYFRLDELIADPEIPAIGLFTGPAGRAELIGKIIRAGKDVMTTKPFELDSAKALKVLKEARSAGRIIHLNSPAPVPDDGLLQIKEWARTYNLGRPIACRCDVWASYREKSDGSWLDDAEKCPAAPIFRLGIYTINDLCGILGEAESVQLFQSRVFTKRPTPDNAQLGILFKNGAIANVFASFCINDGQYYSNALVLNYENGTIYRNIGPLKRRDIAIGDMLSLVVSDKSGDTEIEKKRTLRRTGEYRWDILYDSLNKKPPKDEISPEEIVHGIKITEAMIRAQKSNQSENV